MVPADKLIALGQIVGTHAVRGELRVHLFNSNSTSLRAGTTVVLRRDHEELPRAVRGVRPHKRLALLTLQGCDSMTTAEALVGYEVCVREDQLPAPAPGETYHYQLVGMTVVTLAGDPVGTIHEMLTTAAHDICVVRNGRREHLIPLVADIVKDIDRAGGRVVIDPMPGLLDP